MNAKNWAQFFLLGTIWSSSFMWIKIALREVGPASGFRLRLVPAEKIAKRYHPSPERPGRSAPGRWAAGLFH
jgi:hypothetical protein